ncbi:MAG: signal peptidase II [Clostridia bacterium]|nr:signal peptidase II [Clostridia bacterium]
MKKTDKKIFINYGIIAFLFVFGTAVDLVLKEVFTDKYQTLIDGVISIFYTENTGAGFSLFSDATTFLIVLTSILFIVLVSIAIFCKPTTKTYSFGMGFVLAGALGNLIDRFAFGFVRDFIHLDFMEFPVFNVADVLLTIGVGLLVISVFFRAEKGGPKEGEK